MDESKLLLNIYEALLYLDNIDINCIDCIYLYLSEISKTKRENDKSRPDFDRLKKLINNEFDSFNEDNNQKDCSDISIYNSKIIIIVDEIDKLNIKRKKLEEDLIVLKTRKININENILLLEKTEEKVENIEKQLKRKKEQIKKIERKIDETEIKIKEIDYQLTEYKGKINKYKENFLSNLSFFKEVRNNFFKDIEGFNELKEKYKGLCQIANIVFIENEENIYNLFEAYKECIDKNKEKNQIIFYIISWEDHWYLYVQQKENIFKLNVSSIDSNIDHLKLDSSLFNVYNYNSKDYKIQYSSGCCEMYCVLLPFLITRLCFFNFVNDLKKVFFVDENRKIFKLPLNFFEGLNEKAFSENIRGGKGVKISRIALLEENKKIIDKNKYNIQIYFNTKTTFEKIFSKSLKTEIEYIEKIEENLKLNNKYNIKGSFIYRYALFASSIVDSDYKKYLKEYIIKSLENNKKLEKDSIEYFKKNFDYLFLKFNKSFLGDFTSFKLYEEKERKEQTNELLNESIKLLTKEQQRTI